MIVWLNGPFGAGKTSVAEEIARRSDDVLLFDTEALGYLIRPVLTPRVPVTDFQDWRTWRRLVVTALCELEDESGADLVVPQSVLVEPYWLEIHAGLVAAGHQVLAVSLDLSAAEHVRRVDGDLRTTARRWRHERWPDFLAARGWLARESIVVDTTSMSPEVVADRVLEAVDAEVRPSGLASGAGAGARDASGTARRRE